MVQHRSSSAPWLTPLTGSLFVTCLLALLGCSDAAVFEAGDTEAVGTLEQALSEDGPEGPGVAKTLVPLRELGTPDRVQIKRLRETFPNPGSYVHSVHFYQPAGAPPALYFWLRAETQNGTVEPSHSFTALELISRPGQADETRQTLPNSSGENLYVVPTSREGWYQLDFTYGAVQPNRRMLFMGYDETGSSLQTYWIDPPAATTIDVELQVMATASRHLYLKGGAYRNTSSSAFAYVDNVGLDGYSLYRRGFDQGEFNYPLGFSLAGQRQVTFTLNANGPAKYWIGVNETSFDPAGSKTAWAPLQFLYRGPMHTGDYDAWNEGVAFAQGASLTSGVRPPPVRRGTTFSVAAEHASLAGNANATLRIYPFGSSSETNWPTARVQDYPGGIWNANQGGFQSRQREHWNVSVPSDVAVGRYVIRAFTPGGVKIGSDVMFYVIHDPYRHLTNGLVSKAELETFGYDEDEDGTHLHAPFGSDDDAFRDNFTGNLSPGTAPFTQRGKLTGAFRRTLTETPYSVLDYAMAAAQGTSNEFETMRRLYRMVSQRVGYGRLDIGDDSSRVLMVNGGSFTPNDAAATAAQGYSLPASKKSAGECFDTATTLAAVARSAGILSRSVSVAELGGWGLHVLTEAFMPTLPLHGGKQSWTGGSPNSDTDHWYVFDATNPNGDQPPPGLFTIYSEAIAPRSQYGRMPRIMFGDSVPSVAVTNSLQWDPFTSFASASEVQDVTTAYTAGAEYWLTQSGVTGWLGFGEKDVYRIAKGITGAKAVRVRSLPNGGENLVPKLCVAPATGNPVLPDRCSNPSNNVTLPNGQSYVVVFNDAAELDAYHGDSIQYVLELEY